MSSPSHDERATVGELTYEFSARAKRVSKGKNQKERSALGFETALGRPALEGSSPDFAVRLTGASAQIRYIVHDVCHSQIGRAHV